MFQCWILLQHTTDITITQSSIQTCNQKCQQKNLLTKQLLWAQLNPSKCLTRSNQPKGEESEHQKKSYKAFSSESSNNGEQLGIKTATGDVKDVWNVTDLSSCLKQRIPKDVKTVNGCPMKKMIKDVLVSCVVRKIMTIPSAPEPVSESTTGSRTISHRTKTKNQNKIFLFFCFCFFERRQTLPVAVGTSIIPGPVWFIFVFPVTTTEITGTGVSEIRDAEFCGMKGGLPCDSFILEGCWVCTDYCFEEEVVLIVGIPVREWADFGEDFAHAMTFPDGGDAGGRGVLNSFRGHIGLKRVGGWSNALGKLQFLRVLFQDKKNFFFILIFFPLYFFVFFVFRGFERV